MSNDSIKVVMVGDRSVGKTCLQIVYETNTFPEEYVPTVFNSYIPHIIIDNKKYNIPIWDLQGNSEFDIIRPLSYPHTDVFLLCFSLVSRKSFLNIENKWVNEIRHHCPNTPYILVGLKYDLKKNYQSNNTDSEETDAAKDQKPILTFEIEEMKERINAKGFIECSSLEKYNVKEVFEAACRTTKVFQKNNQNQSNSKCSIF